MRSRQLGMSPAKIAIAVAVTIEAIAGTGSMKKVTGTSSAVAMVAVSPGTAPTNRPNAAEARMTQSTYGSSTRRSASKSIRLQQSPGQRNAQGLVERKMDRHGGEHRHHGGPAPRRAEQARPKEEQRHADDVKTQLVGREDVEHQATDHRRDPDRGASAEHPLGQRDPRRALAYARVDEKQAADAEPDGDQARKPRRAEPLAR